MTINRTGIYTNPYPANVKISDRLFQELRYVERGARSERVPVLVIQDGPRRLAVMDFQDFGELMDGLTDLVREERERPRTTLQERVRGVPTREEGAQ